MCQHAFVKELKPYVDRPVAEQYSLVVAAGQLRELVQRLAFAERARPARVIMDKKERPAIRPLVEQLAGAD